jgi:hypothetical protein
LKLIISTSSRFKEGFNEPEIKRSDEGKSFISVRRVPKYS